MTAKPGSLSRGPGCGLRLPEGVQRGGTAGGEVANQADVLAAMDAAAAVESLEGDFAEGNMPSISDFKFPGPVAEAYFWDDSAVVAIVGPVGSGKTTTKMQRKLRRAIMLPRSTIDGIRHYLVLFIRDNYRQLWSSVIPSYLEVYPRALGNWSGGRGAPVQHGIVFEDAYGLIHWTALFMAFGDDVGASLRGVQVTDLDISEADTNPIETMTFGVGRINRYPGRKHFAGYPPEQRSYGQIDCDFNAPDEDNWTYKVFYDEVGRKQLEQRLSAAVKETGQPIRVAFYRQPGFGEPGTENLQNLAPGYYELQIELNRLTGKSDVTDRMVFNKVGYLRAGDPVFSREFNRRIHVAEGTIQPLPGLGLRIGLDQGFKGAAVIGQFDPPFHWLILGELHFPNERLMAAEFGRRLAELLERRFPGCRIEGGWADMAGEHGASQGADENATWNRLVGQAAGFRVRPQRLGTNRIQPRLEAVRAPLEFVHGGRPGLLIDPSAKFLIRGFEARYVWTDEVDASGDKRKVPDKRLTEANVMDSLQYLLLSEHRANGLSQISFPHGKGGLGPDERRLEGRPMEPEGGIATGYDPLNPYGA